MASKTRGMNVEIQEFILKDGELAAVAGSDIEDVDQFVKAEDLTLINEIGTGPTRIRVFQDAEEFICVLETPLRKMVIRAENDVIGLGRLVMELGFLTNRTIGVKAGR